MAATNAASEVRTEQPHLSVGWRLLLVRGLADDKAFYVVLLAKDCNNGI